MTAEELMLLPDDGRLYQLVEGRLIEVTPSAWIPGMVAANLTGEMQPYVRCSRLGICGTADAGMLLRRAPGTVHAPSGCERRARR